MDLTTDLKNLRGKIGQGGFPCSVKAFSETLDEKNRKAFNEALEDKDITSIALFMYFKDQKTSFSKSGLYKHRAKQCRCYL